MVNNTENYQSFLPMNMNTCFSDRGFQEIIAMSCVETFNHNGDIFMYLNQLNEALSKKKKVICSCFMNFTTTVQVKGMNHFRGKCFLVVEIKHNLGLQN